MWRSGKGIRIASRGVIVPLALFLAGTTPALAQTGAVLEASPNRVAPDSTLTVAWRGTAAPTATVRLALARPGAGGTYGWHTTQGSDSGTFTLVVPGNLAPGTYEVRLVDHRYVLLATSNYFAVEPR